MLKDCRSLIEFRFVNFEWMIVGCNGQEVYLDSDVAGRWCSWGIIQSRE
jgi:hypothetical protein